MPVFEGTAVLEGFLVALSAREKSDFTICSTQHQACAHSWAKKAVGAFSCPERLTDAGGRCRGETLRCQRVHETSRLGLNGVMAQYLFLVPLCLKFNGVDWV
jgi:hypothetical protein